MTLTEIAPGLWVRAEQVLAVRTTRSVSYRNLTSPPSVTVYIPGCYNEIAWEFKTWDEALAWASEITTRINAVLAETQ